MKAHKLPLGVHQSRGKALVNLLPLKSNEINKTIFLTPKIGYDNAAKIAKRALKNKTTLKTEAIKSGLINEKEYDKIVDPKKMTYPT